MALMSRTSLMALKRAQEERNAHRGLVTQYAPLIGADTIPVHECSFAPAVEQTSVSVWGAKMCHPTL